jgi:tellurite resistance protein TerC
VFTSNIFAILGLRALYFCIAGFVARLRYLKVGLALVLIFVAIKMIISDFYKIPIQLSLIVVAGLLAGATVVSLALPAKGPERDTGPGAGPEPD